MSIKLKRYTPEETDRTSNEMRADLHFLCTAFGFTKTCAECGEVKSLNLFNLNRLTIDKHANICKSCQNIRNKKYSESGKAYLRHIKCIYGLSEIEFKRMVESQKGLCAICEEPHKLCVDHCHSTGKVRGLICKPCNTGLGQFNDKIRVIENAAKYLRNTI